MIDTAIIGLGTWGRRLVGCSEGSDAIRFVAAATRTPDRARGFAEEHRLRLHESYEAVLRDAEVQAVVLATPHSQHADQIVAAAEAGKHVFTEKPFTLSVDGARKALAACMEHGVTLAVGYNWRFQPAMQELRRRVRDGRLGRILHIEGNFSGPGIYRFPDDHWRQQPEEGPAGGMTGRGVHVIDAMIHLAGPIDQVSAQSARLVDDRGVDDTTSMLLRFEQGATGYLGTVIATAEHWHLHVFGSRGWARVGGVEHLPTWSLSLGEVDPDDPFVNRPLEEVTYASVSTERLELEHFARAAEAGTPLALPGGDEQHGVAVLEAIVRSASDGSWCSVMR
jgi:predicted dehydrogenase